MCIRRRIGPYDGPDHYSVSTALSKTAIGLMNGKTYAWGECLVGCDKHTGRCFMLNDGNHVVKTWNSPSTIHGW
jgi:hypothetical protein